MSKTECPKCGKSDFTDESYMKKHHKLKHGESLREKYECSAENCDNLSYNPKFCSEECMGQSRRKYEDSVCKGPNCKNSVYKTDYCSQDCANKNSWKNRDNPAKRPEVRKKISEKQMGESNSFYGKSHTQEALEKISESTSGENHHLYGVTGEDHPSHGIASGLKLQTVEKTGHTVRSNWEKEIDILLHDSNLSYEYEPETFDLSNGDTYTPDFVVKKDIVVEVKGWPDDRSKDRARLFMKSNPDITYIVVGNKIPNDIFIAWKNRNRLISKIKEKKE